MSRARFAVIALGMAFALPALSAASAPSGARAADPPQCSDSSGTEADNSPWLWRLRTFQHLDCLLAIADGALGAPKRANTPGDRVELSRQDLERIRTLAWWARDAAGRIER